MAIKGRVKSLDEVPEALREQYVQDGDEYTLQVDGFVPKAKVDEFRTNNVNLLKRISELEGKVLTPEQEQEITQLRAAQKEREEKRLKEEGQYQTLIERERAERAAEKAEYERKMAEYNARVEDLTVGSQFRAAMNKHIAPEFAPYVEKFHAGQYKAIDGKVAIVDSDGNIIDDDVEHYFAETYRKQMPHFYEAPLTTGGGATTSKGATAGSASRRVRSISDLTSAAEKAAYIKAHGLEAYKKLVSAGAAATT